VVKEDRTWTVALSDLYISALKVGGPCPPLPFLLLFCFLLFFVSLPVSLLKFPFHKLIRIHSGCRLIKQDRAGTGMLSDVCVVAHKIDCTVIAFFGVGLTDGSFNDLSVFPFPPPFPICLTRFLAWRRLMEGGHTHTLALSSETCQPVLLIVLKDGVQLEQIVATGQSTYRLCSRRKKYCCCQPPAPKYHRPRFCSCCFGCIRLRPL
jgi:hypothetical protein